MDVIMKTSKTIDTNLSNSCTSVIKNNIFPIKKKKRKKNAIVIDTANGSSMENYVQAVTNITDNSFCIPYF